MIDELVKEGCVNISKSKTNITHENETVKYKISDSVNFQLKHSTKQDIKMLERIVAKYGNLSGKDLETISHNEAPWNAVEYYEEIPYELGYYRNTDFSE